MLGRFQDQLHGRFQDVKGSKKFALAPNNRAPHGKTIPNLILTSKTGLPKQRLYLVFARNNSLSFLNLFRVFGLVPNLRHVFVSLIPVMFMSSKHDTETGPM